MIFLAELEQTAFSIWMRESDWGFFCALVIHSLALGLAVGINIAVALRVLGLASGVPLSLMAQFYPLMRWAVLAVVISGSLLLFAYPAKAISNPVFYFKIACIVVALWISRHLRLQHMSNSAFDFCSLGRSARCLAALALLLWVASVGAGRFLAYTHSILLASSFY